MDDLTVDIDSLVVETGTAPAEDAVTAALQARAGHLLDPDVLTQVGRAVAAGIPEVPPKETI